MHNRTFYTIFAGLVATLLFIGSGNAPAASVKEQMLARIPAINALKDKGLVGENNQGYLEYRSGDQPDKQTVQGENSDRRSVYQEIAKKQGVDPSLVGQRRAKQIADIGAAGHWFQKPDGSWYRK